MDLGNAIDEVAAATNFAGTVRVDLDGVPALIRSYGLADRRFGVPHTPDTRVGVASANKAFTALVIMQLIETGVLLLTTPARELLGDDLPLIDDAVTIEHLLAHRSGIGDYLDEDEFGDVTDYVLTVPVHELTDAESFLRVLDGHQQRAVPGEVFAYNNGGYALLALLAARVAQASFHDLVRVHVLEPAGMARTAFLRSDELPADAATGYLESTGPRTNVLHLPVIGGGDGGIFTTAADVHAFWDAFDHDRIVTAGTRASMVEPLSMGSDGWRYGMGFWLDPTNDAVMLEGCDAGASFRTVHRPSTALTHTVLSNTSMGAWPVTKRLGELLHT
jgi:CubicO group peptidase (beta-lactamase class C family)